MYSPVGAGFEHVHRRVAEVGCKLRFEFTGHVDVEKRGDGHGDDVPEVALATRISTRDERGFANSHCYEEAPSVLLHVMRQVYRTNPHTFKLLLSDQRLQQN
jgi:hypothetical protein